MSDEKLAVSTWAVRQSFKNPNVGFEGIVNFLTENRIKYAELNTFFIKNPPEHAPLLTRAITWHFGGLPMNQIIETLNSNSIKPIVLTIDATNMFQKDQRGRDRQIQYVRAWIDRARDVGIRTLRVDVGFLLNSPPVEILLSRLLATFKSILTYCEDADVIVLFENHFGPTASPSFFQSIAKEIDSPNFGILLDCGNFKPRSEIYDHIFTLKDLIKHVHIKTFNFNDQGQESGLDYERILGDLLKTGYNGFYTIEFEGKVKRRGDDFVGTKKSIDLARKYISW